MKQSRGPVRACPKCGLDVFLVRTASGGWRHYDHLSLDLHDCPKRPKRGGDAIYEAVGGFEQKDDPYRSNRF